MDTNFLRSAKTILIILCVTGTVYFVSQTGYVKAEGEILDIKCARERILNPTGCYASGEKDSPTSSFSFSGTEEKGELGGCKDQENSEKFMCELNKFCTGSGEEKDQTFGKDGLNYSGTTLRFTQANLPKLIRMALTIIFSLLGITALFMAIYGIMKWFYAVRGGGDVSKMTTYFMNGIWGVFFAAGSIGFTYMLFWVFGYRDNIFDFGAVFDELYSVDCEAVVSENGDPVDPTQVQALCDKYNLSCMYVPGKCVERVADFDSCTSKPKTSNMRVT